MRFLSTKHHDGGCLSFPFPERNSQPEIQLENLYIIPNR